MTVASWVAIGVAVFALLLLAVVLLGLLRHLRPLQRAADRLQARQTEAERLQARLEALQPRIEEITRRVERVQAKRASR